MFGKWTKVELIFHNNKTLDSSVTHMKERTKHLEENFREYTKILHISIKWVKKLKNNW